MKHKHTYTALLVIILLASSLKSRGQNETVISHTRHTLHASGATLKFVGMYSVNYERAILNNKSLKININAGAGGWYLSDVSETAYGYSIPVSFNNLIGKASHFFEIDLGLRYTFLNEQSTKNISPFYPIINLGYRYQKQNGKGLIFRAFIGYSGIGLGIGKAF